MNATVNDFIEALPKKNSLTPVELAGVFGKTDGYAILAEIRRGRIAASHVGSQFFISHAEAVRYLESSAFIPEEA